MPSERRQALVDAGIELALDQSFQDLLASVDTRSITERAGVTTGSFFHHFRSRAQFAEAVADRFRAMWDASVDQLVADIEALFDSDGGGEVRSAAQADWDKLEAADAEATLQHLLWSARRQPIGDRTAGEALRDAYGSLLDKALPAYRRALAAMGREPMPPFDEVDLAVTLTALADGIQMRQAVQPDVVRASLFADLVAGAMIALTRPQTEAGAQGDGIDLAALEAGFSVPVGAGSRRTPGEGETWRQIADAAAPLFADRRPSEVRVADVAAAAGVSTSTVYHHFGSVAEVAASGWVRYLPELEAIANRPITATDGPIRRLEEVVTRIVELGREHRGALEGLTVEAVAVAGDGPARRRSIAEVVPLSDLLTPLLREMRRRGDLRRRIDSGVLAGSIIQLVAMRVLSAPADPVERIVDDTLGIVLEGALSGGAVRR